MRVRGPGRLEVIATRDCHFVAGGPVSGARVHARCTHPPPRPCLPPIPDTVFPSIPRMCLLSDPAPAPIAPPQASRPPPTPPPTCCTLSATRGTTCSCSGRPSRRRAAARGQPTCLRTGGAGLGGGKRGRLGHHVLHSTRQHPGVHCSYGGALQACRPSLAPAQPSPPPTFVTVPNPSEPHRVPPCSDSHPERPTFEQLLDTYFEMLPEYQVGGTRGLR